MKKPEALTDEQWQVIEGLYEMAAHTYGYVRAHDDYRDDHNIGLLGDSLFEMREAFPGINKGPRENDEHDERDEMDDDTGPTDPNAN